MPDRSYPRGAHLAVRWAVIANHFDGDTFRATLTLENRGDVRLPGTGWAIYFNSCRKPLPDSVTGGVAIDHVNGDLFRLSPGARFGTLAAGVSREIGYLATFWAIVDTDAPLGLYIVYDEGTPDARAEAIGDPEIASFDRPEQTQRTPSDRVPLATPGTRFERNQRMSRLPESSVGKITPAPSSASYGAGRFAITADACIACDPQLENEAAMLREGLARTMLRPPGLAAPGVASTICLRLDAALDPPAGSSSDEAYRLSVTARGIDLSARSAEGVYRGVQSLLQLLPPSAWRNPEEAVPIPACDVHDAPRFAYRGLLIDVARNFSSKASVLRVIDAMALYKLNKLHFHLTDDEGWRVPIPSLPELTEIGAKRGFDPGENTCLAPSFGSGADVAGGQGSGHYTRDEFIEILRYATARHIEVIPEIDLPGHARAAIKAMQVRYARLIQAGRAEEAGAYVLADSNDASKYESVQMWKDNVVCIGLESCYTFLDTVVGDLKMLFDEAGVALRTLHVGGDEVPHGAWKQSPVCQAFMREQGMTTIRELEGYFFARFRAILGRHGIGMAGWEEVALVDREQGGVTSSTPNPALAGSLRSHVWNNVWGWGREDIAYRLANAGYETVLCNVTNLYLDLAYEKHPNEPGYYWGGFLDTRTVFEFCPLDIYTLATVDLLGQSLDPDKVGRMERLTPAGEKRVIGLQGHVWGENVRSASRLEYLLLPRLIAVAERAWAQDPHWTRVADPAERRERMDRDWNEFANRLGQRDLPRLDGFGGGYGYRAPVPGAKIEKRILSANVSAPGLTLRYTTDGTEPTVSSPVLDGSVPMAEGASATVAAFGTTGRRSRSARVIGDR